MSEHYAFILVNAQKWWNRRISQNRTGKKIHAFVRRGTVGPKTAQYVLLYVKHPLREIRGRGASLNESLATLMNFGTITVTKPYSNLTKNTWSFCKQEPKPRL